jgi:predicted RNA binding protein YcfA (HicA-like mRNA interferase family)
MTRRERDLRRLAEARGWRLERTGSGHWRLRHPNGQTVIASFSPGDSGHLRVIAGYLNRAERQRAAP